MKQKSVKPNSSTLCNLVTLTHNGSSKKDRRIFTIIHATIQTKLLSLDHLSSFCGTVVQA